MARNKTQNGLLIILLFLSSFSALVSEVSWSRMLGLALGGTVVSATIVLTAFMAGLALGSLFWGRLADRWERPARLFGICQLAIGFGAVMSYVLISLIPRAYAGHAPLFIPYGLAIAAVLAASFAIGGVYPIFAKAYIQDSAGIGRGVGAAGGLAAGFILLGTVGQFKTMALAAALNLAAGIVALILPPGTPTASEEARQPGAKSKQDQNSPIMILAAAGLAGLAGMALQVVWIRILKIFLPNTSYSFSRAAGWCGCGTRPQRNRPGVGGIFTDPAGWRLQVDPNIGADFAWYRGLGGVVDEEGRREAVTVAGYDRLRGRDRFAVCGPAHHGPAVVLPRRLAGRRVIHYRETVEGAVTVSEDARTGIRACYVNNSGVVGTTYDAIKAVKLLGHLPFLIGCDAREVLVVGFGIGVTAATIASHPEVKRIDCVEIAPGVGAAAGYFTAYNRGAALSPLVSFIADDGRAYLTRTGKTYDLISADPPTRRLAAPIYTPANISSCAGPGSSRASSRAS
ncbi:MAG: hypothetical protein QME74_04440 [Candidatus Edwardsbacteria bacterium]|nr:hypothetical protein [Candidatus Edwardsbacteria bacterium]